MRMVMCIHPHAECKVIGEAGETVAPGEVGELCVRGPQVTPEYKSQPDHTAKAKIYGSNGVFWHRMGDLVYQDEQGRLWFCGRKSHRVTLTNSELIFPVPCEGVFNEHPEVYRSAVVGVNGEAILVVELEPSSNTPRATITDELIKIGASNPKTRHIQRILYHEGFPVDVRHNAKIHRLQLAEWAGSQR